MDFMPLRKIASSLDLSLMKKKSSPSSSLNSRSENESSCGEIGVPQKVKMMEYSSSEKPGSNISQYQEKISVIVMPPIVS
jgi:hypothetical protein